jgi:hypothetical protein
MFRGEVIVFWEFCGAYRRFGVDLVELAVSPIFTPGLMAGFTIAVKTRFVLAHSGQSR